MAAESEREASLREALDGELSRVWVGCGLREELEENLMWGGAREGGAGEEGA